MRMASIETIVDGVVEAKTSYVKATTYHDRKPRGSLSDACGRLLGALRPLKLAAGERPRARQRGLQSLPTHGHGLGSSEFPPKKCRASFPLGNFRANGEAHHFQSDGTDYLAMPHPACGEVYVIKADLFHKSYARHALPDHIPSEAETISQWESVLRQDARVCRKKTDSARKDR